MNKEEAYTAYIEEYIRQKYWRYYLKNTSNQLLRLFRSEKLSMKDKNILQILINFNTLVIGMDRLPRTIFFPNADRIRQYQGALFSEIEFNIGTMTSLQKGKILTIIIDNMDSLREKFINESSNIAVIDLNIKVVKNGEKTQLSVTNPEYKNDFTVSTCYYERLKKMYICQNYSDIWIVILLLRYRYYTFIQHGICLSVGSIYKIIKEHNLDDISLEAFAGSLNSNLTHYCSLFYDVEKYFGSKGSFLVVNPLCDHSIIISNPPYIDSVMEKAAEILVNFMDECQDDRIVISTIPDWRSVSEYEADREIEIKLSNTEIKRSTVPYMGYAILRNSKYFRRVYHLGAYKYHNFFKDKDVAINVDTIIVVLAKGETNEHYDIIVDELDKTLG